MLITASTSVMISTGRQEQPCASALSVLQLSVLVCSSGAACPACIRADVQGQHYLPALPVLHASVLTCSSSATCHDDSNLPHPTHQPMRLLQEGLQRGYVTTTQHQSTEMYNTDIP